MEAKDFCYWLNGAIELGSIDLEKLTPDQAKCIKEHLALVFTKVTSPTPTTMPNPLQPSILHPRDYSVEGTPTFRPYGPFGPSMCSVGQDGVKQTYCIQWPQTSTSSQGCLNLTSETEPSTAN